MVKEKLGLPILTEEQKANRFMGNAIKCAQNWRTAQGLSNLRIVRGHSSISMVEVVFIRATNDLLDDRDKDMIRTFMTTEFKSSMTAYAGKLGWTKCGVKVYRCTRHESKKFCWAIEYREPDKQNGVDRRKALRINLDSQLVEA